MPIGLTPIRDIDGDTAQWGVLACGLSNLTRLGAPVPPGFVLPAVASRRFLTRGEFDPSMIIDLPARIESIDRQLMAMTQDPNRPLLLAVRGSAPITMPTKMDTLLSIGMTPEVRSRVADWSDDRNAAMVWLRFVSGYAHIIRRVTRTRIEKITDTITNASPIEAIEDAAHQIVTATIDETQKPIPDAISDQLAEAIEAVCASWQRSPARQVRTQQGLTESQTPAVVVHAMVLPKGTSGGVGVAFSRSPVTGNPTLSGNFDDAALLPEDSQQWSALAASGLADTKKLETLTEILGALERDLGCVARVDFVSEDERLWCVDGRPADLEPTASIRTAVDLAIEGVVSERQALLGVDPDHLETVATARLSPHSETALTYGSGAAPGAASGLICLDIQAVNDAIARDLPAILVTREIRPEDVVSLGSVAGVLADRGGKASHAALVTRGIGTPAVIGASNMSINLPDRTISVGGTVLAEGDWITLDGTTGEVFAGNLSLENQPVPKEIATLLAWADQWRTLEVWGNVDNPAAAALVRAAKGEGVGLARTEHMFSGERLSVVRQLLTTVDPRARSIALGELEEAQIGDFETLLTSMDGLPVVVRLLDPPLHEFLPDRISILRDIRSYATQGLDTAPLERIERAVSLYEESNPMLGMRGVRLAIVMPEIYRVQVLAALEAVRRRLDAGGDPQLHLMVPLVGTVEELTVVRNMIEEEVHQAGRLLEVSVGTMIELPRAALVADAIALQSDFFSFGTNDLTQTTLGISRDDAEEAFLRTYIDRGLLSANPFQTLDIDGVGQLMKMAITKARSVNPEIKIGVCGEHGGDPASIAFFHTIGVDYVSCSPPRIASARLAAAQAAINHSE
jgi:pyruvate, orthophosphate dikinase